jgi:hypothetical protein
MGEKLGVNPRTGQSACCALGQEPFFSGAVDLFKSVDGCMKGCYELTTWDTYGLGPYTNWVWDVCGVLVMFLLQGVHQFESPQLSDMSNHLFAVVSTHYNKSGDTWRSYFVIDCFKTVIEFDLRWSRLLSCISYHRSNTMTFVKNHHRSTKFMTICNLHRS